MAVRHRIFVPDGQWLDPELVKHLLPHRLLERDTALRRLDRLIGIFDRSCCRALLLLAPNPRDRGTRVRDRLRESITAAEIDDPPLRAARDDRRQDVIQQWGVPSLELLELRWEGLETENPVGRASSAQDRAPELALELGRTGCEAIRARPLEVQIFERSTKTAGPPQQMAEESASGSRDRGEKIGEAGSLQSSRKIELPLISGDQTFVPSD